MNKKIVNDDRGVSTKIFIEIKKVQKTRSRINSRICRENWKPKKQFLHVGNNFLSR